jgi:hypothetical protein
MSCIVPIVMTISQPWGFLNFMFFVIFVLIILGSFFALYLIVRLLWNFGMWVKSKRKEKTMKAFDWLKILVPILTVSVLFIFIFLVRGLIGFQILFYTWMFSAICGFIYFIEDLKKWLGF